MNNTNDSLVRTAMRIISNLTSERQEVKCTDEYSSYCWDKEWGSCPVYCKSDQTTCYATTYLSTGPAWVGGLMSHEREKKHVITCWFVVIKLHWFRTHTILGHGKTGEMFMTSLGSYNASGRRSGLWCSGDGNLRGPRGRMYLRDLSATDSHHFPLWTWFYPLVI